MNWIKKSITSLLSLGSLATASLVGNPNQADIIVATNQVLYNSIWVNEYANLKDQQGLDVAVVAIPDLDINNPGAAWSQRDIRNTLKQHYIDGGQRLKYIMLVGDASYVSSYLLTQNGYAHLASRNYASSTTRNFIPGPTSENQWNQELMVNGQFDYELANHKLYQLGEEGLIWNDDYYGDFHPSHGPEVMVGRIPASNQTDITQFIQKLKKYHQGLTSNVDAITPFQSSFHSVIHDVVEYVPPEITRHYAENTIQTELDPGVQFTSLRSSDYLADFNAGNPVMRDMLENTALFINYMSGAGRRGFHPFMAYYPYHGGVSDRLQNVTAQSSGNFPVSLLPICDRGNFDRNIQKDIDRVISLLNGTTTYTDGYFENSDYFLEEFLLTPDRGVISFIANRGNSHNAENHQFGRYFYRAAYAGVSTIGEAKNMAENAVALLLPQLKDRREDDGTYIGARVLLGDPALPINTASHNAPSKQVGNLQVTSTQGTIVASWNNVSGADGYKVGISVGGKLLDFTSTKTNSIKIGKYLSKFSFSHNEQVSIQVIPFATVTTGNGTINTMEKGTTTKTTITTDMSINAPSTILTTPQPGAVSIDWSSVSDSDLKEYELIRVNEDGQIVNLGIISSNTLNYVDQSGEYLSTYRYGIRAVDQNGNISAWTLSEPVHRYANIAVWAKDDQINNAVLLSPIIYIENLGEANFGNYVVKYWFTKANSQGGILNLEEWYTPESSPSITMVDEEMGLGYIALHYTQDLDVGSVTAQGSQGGAKIGLHYNNWKLYNKSSDFSNQGLSNTFATTNFITVTQLTAGGEVQVYGQNIDLIPEAQPQNLDVSTYVKDGTVQDVNTSRISMYMTNNSKTIRNFKSRYYFTAEAGKTPVIDMYFQADASSWELVHQADSYYYVEFTYEQALSAGESTSGMEGVQFGIHYSDWSPFLTDNDFSYAGVSENWNLNDNVLILDSEGDYIDGNEPDIFGGSSSSSSQSSSSTGSSSTSSSSGSIQSVLLTQDNVEYTVDNTGPININLGPINTNDWIPQKIMFSITPIGSPLSGTLQIENGSLISLDNWYISQEIQYSGQSEINLILDCPRVQQFKLKWWRH